VTENRKIKIKSSYFREKAFRNEKLHFKKFQIPISKVNITSIRTAIKKPLLIQFMTALPIKSP
jgi:hypothetical protein